MENINDGAKSKRLTFITLSALFLLWGLITVMSGFLVQQLMNAFGLNYVHSVIMALTFFGTYLFISIPAGWLIDKVGFKNGIRGGLGTAAIGSIMLYLAAVQHSFIFSVLALFAVAMGITILQVGANPYTFLAGNRGKGAQRLTFVQAFNSLGTVIATQFAGRIFQTDESLDPESLKDAFAAAIQMPCLIMGIVLILFTMIVSFTPLPRIETHAIEPIVREDNGPRRFSWQFHHVLWGCLAIFAYVGAEETIFRFLLVEMHGAGNDVLAMKIDGMIALYWTGLMVGRFVGAALLSRVSPRSLIAVCALSGASLILFFIAMAPFKTDTNWISALWILTLTGLFNSVLFPCIFSMSVDGLGKFTEEASALLIMSVAGGAVIPFLVFEIIPISTALAFVIILLAYLAIAYFGIKGSRYAKRAN